MRLAAKNRGLIATILVIAVTVAALALLCFDGMHVPLAGGISDACAAMAHTIGLGAASDTDPTSVVSLFIVAVVGLTLTFASAFVRPTSSRLIVSLGSSAGPLNGRLRL